MTYIPQTIHFSPFIKQGDSIAHDIIEVTRQTTHNQRPTHRSQIYRRESNREEGRKASGVEEDNDTMIDQNP